MNETQQELFKLLCEFDDICTENGIEYILAGGAALGAVRNGGFLPWDDDIDILITRDNYEKLDRYLNSVEIKDRQWMTEDNTKVYTNPVARYVDTSTTLAYRFMLAMGVPIGFHLEIFILDPCPRDPQEQLKFRQNLWLYTELRNKYFISANPKLPVEVTDEEVYREYQRRIEEQGLDSVIADIKHEITKHEIQDTGLWCGRWSYAAYIFEDEWINKRSWIEFEGRKFPVAIKVLHHMRENYDANWNLVPKEANRVVHNGISNTNQPYCFYEEEINNILDNYNFEENVIQARRLNIERYFYLLKVQRLRAEIRLGFLTKEIQRLETTDCHFDPDRVEEHEENLKTFFGVQLLPTYKKFHLKPLIADDLKETIIMVLVYLDKYDEAVEFLDLYNDWDRYDDLRKMLWHLGEMKLEKYYGNFEDVQKHLEILEKEYGLSNQIEVERTIAWCEAQKVKIRWNAIRKLENRLKHKNDYEIIKYIGDMYEKRGKQDLALKMHQKAYSKTQNGMIIKGLIERYGKEGL